MEKSASAPVLQDEDYKVPGHGNGVGLTGHPDRVTHGAFSKDKGTFSSRINQIMRQADKVPGPGKYVAHDDWKLKGGCKFPKGSLDYKAMNKNPAPATYEHKDFFQGKSIGNGDNMSNRKRVVLGHMTKGKRRSMLDQAEKVGRSLPAPGTYHNTCKYANKLDTDVIKVLSWSKEMTKSKGRGQVKPEIGPNHYTLNWKHLEESPSCITVPKALAQNFLDKAVKEKWTDARTKKEIPGPGTYSVHNFDDSKISRGTRYSQIRGLSRSAISGYF